MQGFDGMSLSAVEFSELPGNHVLARMSHEATERSLAGADAAGRSSRQPAEAVSHDAGLIEAMEAKVSPQDCVDEASLESFPASDPPAYTQIHA